MELFRQINNEALDEDRKAQKQVIETIKKQVSLFNQQYKEPVELNDTVLNNIEKYIINFDDTLNKTLNDVKRRGEQKEDTGDLVLNYNLLANYLDKVNFNIANANDKRDVITLLDELTPKIGVVLSSIKVKDYTDKDLVEKVYNNFKNRTYNIILEKERKQERSLTEKEKKEIESPLIDLDTKVTPTEVLDTDATIKQRLEAVIRKARQIILEKPKGNKRIETDLNKATTYLQLYENKQNPALREVVSFLNSSEKRIGEYLNKGKSLLETDLQKEEREPTTQLDLKPSLQEGADEPSLQLPSETQLQLQDELFGDIEGSGKRKVYKKRK
jgi:hypothetical protein